MKKIYVTLTAILLISTRLQAQGFANLNFAGADIQNGTAAGSLISITNAIPGWIGYIGTSQQTSVLYNSLYTGTSVLAILGTNSPVSGNIPGNNYTIVLQAGSGGDLSETASIAQTALIPASAESIEFTASFPYGAGWQVAINGQVIPVSEIGSVNSYYNIYAGNISAFAGNIDQLEFTALTSSGPSVNLYLDNISFSSNPVPEPRVFRLVTLASLFLMWRCRQKFHQTKA